MKKFSAILSATGAVISIIGLFVTVLWSAYFFYMHNANRIFDFGGLAFLAISSFVYPIGFVSTIYLCLYCKKSTTGQGVWEKVRPPKTLQRGVFILGGVTVVVFAYSIAQNEFRKTKRKQALNQVRSVAQEMFREVSDNGSFRISESLLGVSDPWGKSLRFRMSMLTRKNLTSPTGYLNITSAGPDRVFDTNDDVGAGHKYDYLKALDTKLSKKYLALLDSEVFEEKVSSLQSQDAWGNALMYETKLVLQKERQSPKGYMKLTSFGKDGLFDTDDDIYVKKDISLLRPAYKNILRFGYPDYMPAGEVYSNLYYLFRGGSMGPMLQLMSQQSMLTHILYPNAENDFKGHMQSVDKWGGPIQFHFYENHAGLFVQLVSAGADKVFGSRDDIRVSRPRRGYSEFSQAVEYERHDRDRIETHRKIREVVKENREYVEANKESYFMENPKSLAMQDNWGQQIILFHQHNMVFAQSYGGDGIRDTMDDLIYGATRYKKREVVTISIPKNNIPQRIETAGDVTPLYEIEFSRTGDSRNYTIALGQRGSSISSLRQRYSKLFFQKGGAMCRATLNEISVQPARRCSHEHPELLVGNYVLEEHCAEHGYQKAFATKPEVFLPINMEEGMKLSGDKVSMLPGNQIIKECNYQSMGGAEFYYCPRKEGKDYHHMPYLSYMYVDKKLVFLQRDYVPLGRDGGGYFADVKKDFVAYYELGGTAYYMLRSGKVVFRSKQGWRTAAKTPWDYYYACD